jgi:hypothetical protein
VNLPQFAARNVWRNKRRSILTILSLGFSFLLLTLMMTIWDLRRGLFGCCSWERRSP